VNAPAILHDAREQWLMDRASRVTGTDAADIISHALGEDHFRAPAEILAAKWGLSGEFKDNEPAKWGRRLQRIVGEVYAEETGRKVSPVPEYTSWQHPDIPWLSASGDALVEIHRDGLTKECPLEIKTDGVFWKDGAPSFRHLTQVTIETSCLGSSVGAVTAFVDRYRPLVSSDVDFDAGFFASCLPILEEFHHYLKTRTMPTDPKWFTKGAVKAFWPMSNGAVVAFNDDDLRLVNRWERLKLFSKWAAEQKDAVEVALAVRLGDAEQGFLPDGSSYKFKRSLVAAQLCPHGSVIRAEHTRGVPSRFWPKHLKPAPKALPKKG